jgi:peptidoglycan/xylan/chitin deacetylase (PgdA/CDA1 family)
MKNLIKSVIHKFLSFFKPGGIVVLMYHSVADNDEFFTVKPSEFERQMKFLKENNFEVIDLEELMNLDFESAKNKVILTFDDGYEDNFLNAFPVLKKYNFRATIFINTDLMGKEITARKGTKMKILSEFQIKEMAKSGIIKFGSHGHRHLKLSKLSEAEIERELKISKEILEKITGQKIISFAYPYGDYDERVKNIATKFFKILCTILKGQVKNKNQLLELPRSSIDSKVSFSQFKYIVKIGRI